MQKSDITPLVSEESSVIENIASGIIKISGKYWRDNILVSGYEVYSWPLDSDDAFLSIANINQAMDYIKSLLGYEDTGILLVGGGSEQPDLTFTATSDIFYDKIVSVDIMTTAAACRTFNVLSAEGRKVFALLKQI